MRADRLVAVLLLLQSRGRVTAAEVAVELEVSLATARRDLAALASAGVPVYPQAGRGGGWSLVGGARTDLSGLTRDEARALFLTVGPTATSPRARTALRKLVRALPGTFRADAEAAAEAVVVDPARWGGQEAAPPGLVEELQRAVVSRTRVRLDYASRTGRTLRTVDPLGLVDKDDVWYLLAQTPRGRRTFRLDRIGDLETLDERFERPDGFDLVREWQRVVGEVEARRSLTSATVVVPTRFLPVLRTQFGRHCTDVRELGGGRARCLVAAPAPLDLARTLAGWGAGIEVEGPASVRAELGRIGRELVQRYP
ncbi:helix-turn-helix transcriptional regulator [Kineococcus rhizosphaerae]|uniref:Putative DNA-binding transcriptional regulator YafY n=1 Tax=Kineococcus rhizosphaerae TaxID=559628 RepID=A0A2T0QXN4_9ACTN|nr:WYL domain-containing protein [Kineococcus rhizosphaerae]PRY10789.1 putative DNA-binding transcriptional regulator YafY [Kineococcus rhizosphaerae]